MEKNCCYYVTRGHIVYFCCHVRPTCKIGYSEIQAGKYEFQSPMERSKNHTTVAAVMTISISWTVLTAGGLSGRDDPNQRSRFISLWNFDVKLLNRFTVGSNIPAACNMDDGLRLVGWSGSVDSLAAAVS